MSHPFSLKSTIGEDYNMDLDDTLNTKIALTGLGHMKAPPHGITEFPDRPMIDGVKDFQAAHGLKKDGVMKEDGPTIAQLNKVLADKLRPQPKPANAGQNAKDNEKAIREFQKKFTPGSINQPRNQHGDGAPIEPRDGILDKVNDFIRSFQDPGKIPFMGDFSTGGVAPRERG